MQPKRFLYILLTMALIAATASGASDIYVKVVVHPDGQLQIITKNGRTISLKKDKEQVGYGDPVISEDGTAAGWTGLFMYGTSYPVPWVLQVYSAGKLHGFGIGGGMPIAEWRFVERGKQVAFRAETLHGEDRDYFQLSEVASNRIIARYDPAESPGNRFPNGPKVLT